jgi:hypothetical protein
VVPFSRQYPQSRQRGQGLSYRAGKSDTPRFARIQDVVSLKRECVNFHRADQDLMRTRLNSFFSTGNFILLLEPAENVAFAGALKFASQNSS